MLIAGRRAVFDFLACSASLRCLEHAARLTPRCRAGAARGRRRAQQTTRGQSSAATCRTAPSRRSILLGIMSWAKHEGPNVDRAELVQGPTRGAGSACGGRSRQGGALAAVKAAKAARGGLPSVQGWRASVRHPVLRGGARCRDERGLGPALFRDAQVAAFRGVTRAPAAGYELTALVLPPPPPPPPVPGMEVTARERRCRPRATRCCWRRSRSRLWDERSRRGTRCAQPHFDQVLTIKEGLALRYSQNRGTVGRGRDPSEGPERVGGGGHRGVAGLRV